jgi:hypothetical protein
MFMLSIPRPYSYSYARAVRPSGIPCALQQLIRMLPGRITRSRRHSRSYRPVTPGREASLLRARLWTSCTRRKQSAMRREQPAIGPPGTAVWGFRVNYQPIARRREIEACFLSRFRDLGEILTVRTQNLKSCTQLFQCRNDVGRS